MVVRLPLIPEDTMRSGLLIGMLGLWLVASTFVDLDPLVVTWNAWAVGVIAAAWGFGVLGGRPWQGVVAGVLGLWLVVFGFIAVTQTGPILVWSNILVGIGLALAGLLPIKRRSTREGYAS
jgi:hypothetical protein